MSPGGEAAVDEQVGAGDERGLVAERNTTGSATSSTSREPGHRVGAANPALTSGGFRRVIAVRV